METTQTDLVLPVVIVGKDRTRMTCAVIDHIKAHLKNAKPYFICVSDRSRPGHDIAIENHLREIGETEYEVLRTLPEENRYGWGAAINIGLECAFDVCKGSESALVVDNDWLLQRELDYEKYLYTFEYSDIGAITFKPVHEGTNIAVREIGLSDGSKYLLRSPAPKNGKYSFTAELGCVLLSRRMKEAFGRFKENCRTDETEWGFCNWYNALLDEQRISKHVWYATDMEMYHTELNGKDHVFTHVGLVSQHEGPHKWECPEEYKYLSDDEADKKACAEAYRYAIYLEEKEEERCCASEYKPIPWSKYFDRIYCFHYLPHEKKLPRLTQELSRVGIMGSGIFEFRYTTPSKNDKDLCEIYQQKMPHLTVGYVNQVLELRRLLTESIHFGHKRILILEDDIAFLRDLEKMRDMLDAIPEDADLIHFDKFVNDGYACKIYTELERKKEEGEYYLEYTEGSFTSSACFALSLEGMKELLRLCDECIDAVDQYFKFMKCKRYLTVPNLCVQTHYTLAYSIAHGNIGYMHKVYKNCGVDYSLYAVPDGYDYGCVYDGEKSIKVVRDSNAMTNPIKKKGRKFVSVYAIAKNEASVAARWYECVKEADEVCVLDTGSTDDTVKILRDLGARVEIKTYDDWSFAVARNDSMKMVSPESEILFTLDLDETIAPGWRKRLEDAWIAEEAKGYKPAGVLYKYIWSWLPDGKEAQSYSVRKIHANGKGKWKYRCHELLTEVNGHTFFLDGFVVEHHQNRQTNRSKYLPLLEKDAKEMPNDDRSAYYYARELMYNEKWHQAKNEFERHLSLPSAGWRAERASSMRNIAKCYEHLKSDMKRELWLWRAAEEDPTNRDATYYLGVMALDRKDYRTAVKVLQRCIEIEHPSLEYISDPIVWSSYPWMFYSQALWWVNRWDDAINACKKALDIDPNNGEVKAQLDGMIATRDHFNSQKA